MGRETGLFKLNWTVFIRPFDFSFVRSTVHSFFHSFVRSNVQTKIFGTSALVQAYAQHSALAEQQEFLEKPWRGVQLAESGRPDKHLVELGMLAYD